MTRGSCFQPGDKNQVPFTNLIHAILQKIGAVVGAGGRIIQYVPT